MRFNKVESASAAGAGGQANMEPFVPPVDLNESGHELPPGMPGAISLSEARNSPHYPRLVILYERVVRFVKAKFP